MLSTLHSKVPSCRKFCTAYLQQFFFRLPTYTSKPPKYAKIFQQLRINPMHVIANIFLLWSCELALKGSNLGIAQAGGILFLGILPYRQFNLVLECHGDSFGQSSSVCQWGQGCGFVKILRTITSKLTGSSRRRSPPNHSQDGLSFAGSCNSVIIRLPKSDKKMPWFFQLHNQI